MTYAATTTVTERESRAQIEALLARYGAVWSEVGLNAHGHAVVKFSASGREVRMMVHMPPEGSRERPRRWRVLGLLLKAKLEAVDSGLATFEHEFLAHISLPNGKTVGQSITPHLESAYLTGRTPAQIGGPA
jgi:hypothetical protein